MTELDFESAQLELLTEALRAGPGSPAWREALATLEAIPGADEYKLLYDARERLASGREYREIRAGAGFTRRVFDQIDQEESAAPRAAVPSANVIAAISALVILGVVAVVAFFAIPRGGVDDVDVPAAADLSRTYFVTTRAQSTFETELGMEWPTFGALPVQANNGLQPVLKGLRAAPGEGFVGGGVFHERTFAANEPFAVEATVRAPRGSGGGGGGGGGGASAGDNVIVQLFATDDPKFSGDSATTPRELVWLLRAGEASVALPDGTIASQGTRVRDGRSVEVRIAVNRKQATIEMNGQRLWAGTNQLSDRPRLIGIRFLARGGEQKDTPVIESIRVLVPQK